MAYFGKARDKKSHDHDVGEKAKNHACRLSGAFCRVNGKLAPVQNRRSSTGNSAKFIETSNREESREVTCKHSRLWRSAFVQQLHSNVQM